MNSSLSKGLLAFYLFVLVPTNLLGHFFDVTDMVLFSKPLLMPVLMGLFLTQAKGISSNIKYGVLGALFFSWVGDVALMFDSVYSFMFIVGLGGFLIAHLHYVYVFIKSNKKGSGIPKKAWLIIPVFVVFTAGLISVLWPKLGELQIPVFVYAIVLMIMGITAVSRNVKTGFYWVLFGAILFVTSDSILAINKFYIPFVAARVLTMLTYTLAQLFIILGLSNTIGAKV